MVVTMTRTLQTLLTGATFELREEITTLIAMVVWAIVAWVVGRSMWLVMSRPR